MNFLFREMPCSNGDSSGDSFWLNRVCGIDRPYKMPREAMAANARKRSETQSGLCVSVNRRDEQEKAFCRAKGSFFFSLFFL
jgi:hypothetical protein